MEQEKKLGFYSCREVYDNEMGHVCPENNTRSVYH